ncbi:MAG TPA: glycoside hydrolase family 3 C-terminal domain-containing protein [Candidatus Atribacteria bacterium]|nr:glycoside hydrolase family 3 C-terminal domain-containing protein [Candidatus Atribacteria bacterium]
MNRDIDKIISQMTLEEKAGLCSGFDAWHTKPVERLNIPSIMMSDGPHGLRKQATESDHLGLHQSVPAICFPSGAGLACSWDRDLLKEVGAALAEECQAEGVSIILGPAANIKRSPLCGRNFEYFSEDPYLSSQMAASHIRGVQSGGVGTSLKHFVANNQEHRRMSVDAIIDERTLREIYLASFEAAVKEARPWTVMCAYNKVNGTYCSQNRYLLTDILREEWGFDGFVVSDWGAVDERVEGLIAGLELEMPSSGGIRDKKIVEAVKNGKLSEEVLDKAVKRLLSIIFKAVDNKKESVSYDKKAHHALARKVAEQCMVLLKNDDNILPLKESGTIAVIGAFAKHPRYQGGGSSHVNPTEIDAPYEKIKEMSKDIKLLYADGYKLDSDEVDETLLSEAKSIAKQADVAIIFAGLPERYESEGYDRLHMQMPDNHNRLIEAVSAVQSNTIVVLSNGAPVEMPWISSVKGLIEAYLGGQAFGGAIANVLFGRANPCGKLAETFPETLPHNPSYLNFPGEDDRVEYREGLFVGYRYYDAKKIEPLFPFGYGLSYTTFEYTDISVDKKEINDTDTVTVKAKVKNTGKVTGKEIVQLYVRDIEHSVIRPEKELKEFCKVELAPGQEETVEFVLDKRAFAYYNADIKDWHVESGDFEILIGSSSKDIALRETIKVNSTVRIKKQFTRNSLLGDIMADPAAFQVMKELAAQLNIPLGAGDKKSDEIMLAMLKYTPLRALIAFSGGAFTEDMMNMLINKLNEIG